MSTTFNILIFILGIVEIGFALNMEKFTRAKYSGEKVKDLTGLIKWEKITTLILGIMLILFAAVSFISSNDKYSNYFIAVILAIMVISFFGKKKYINR